MEFSVFIIYLLKCEGWLLKSNHPLPLRQDEIRQRPKRVLTRPDTLTQEEVKRAFLLGHLENAATEQHCMGGWRPLCEHRVGIEGSVQKQARICWQSLSSHPNSYMAHLPCRSSAFLLGHPPSLCPSKGNGPLKFYKPSSKKFPWLLNMNRFLSLSCYDIF